MFITLDYNNPSLAIFWMRNHELYDLDYHTFQNKDQAPQENKLDGLQWRSSHDETCHIIKLNNERNQSFKRKSKLNT